MGQTIKVRALIFLICESVGFHVGLRRTFSDKLQSLLRLSFDVPRGRSNYTFCFCSYTHSEDSLQFTAHVSAFKVPFSPKFPERTGISNAQAANLRFGTLPYPVFLSLTISVQSRAFNLSRRGGISSSTVELAY